MVSDGPRFFDRQGRRIDYREAGRLLEDVDYRRVAWDAVGDLEVSTVWLGLDHSFGLGPPLIFETMIFEAGPLNTECRRYGSEAAALAGHREVARGVSAGAGPPVVRSVKVDLADGLYAVVRDRWAAGFIVKGGRVAEGDCAPILRRRLAYWATVARRI